MKERMITRTIKSADVDVMTIDTATADVRINTYTTEPQDSEEKYLKVLRKKYETDTFKLVKIKKIELQEDLYCMTEREFIDYGKIISKR